MMITKRDVIATACLLVTATTVFAQGTTPPNSAREGWTPPFLPARSCMEQLSAQTARPAEDLAVVAWYGLGVINGYVAGSADRNPALIQEVERRHLTATVVQAHLARYCARPENSQQPLQAGIVELLNQITANAR